jgi:L-iditol 2-dehydrogenase
VKAVVFHGPGDLRLEERPRPRIADDELLVKIEACALCGSDARTFRFGASNITGPVVMGHEMAGTVAEVGRAVRVHEPGARVAVAPAIPCGQCRYCLRGRETVCDGLRSIGYEFDGGFAEYMVVPASAVRAGCVNAIPDALGFIEAAVAEPLACVINGQDLLGVGPEDEVVVLGAGPVGCLHADLAKVRGARKVLLADLRPERLEMARSHGADVLLDASREDLRQRVLEETDGHGASVVVVAAPSRAAQEQAVTLAAKRGRIDFFGGLPKTEPFISLDANLVHYRELSIMGAYGSRPAQNREALALLAAGRIRVSNLVSRVLPLESVREGLEAIASGSVLKVVLKP